MQYVKQNTWKLLETRMHFPTRLYPCFHAPNENDDIDLLK